MRMCLADFLIHGAYSGLINYFKKMWKMKKSFLRTCIRVKYKCHHQHALFSFAFSHCIVFFVHLSKILISATELERKNVESIIARPSLCYRQQFIVIFLKNVKTLFSLTHLRFHNVNL